MRGGGLTFHPSSPPPPFYPAIRHLIGAHGRASCWSSLCSHWVNQGSRNSPVLWRSSSHVQREPIRAWLRVVSQTHTSSSDVVLSAIQLVFSLVVLPCNWAMYYINDTNSTTQFPASDEVRRHNHKLKFFSCLLLDGDRWWFVNTNTFNHTMWDLAGSSWSIG